MPFVSIGISFYNAETTLLDAVRSVFMQTHQNWELILVDDGSTDKSLSIAQTIKDPRVRVYSDGKNKKLAARLNQIIDLAKYDFIARMDADDLIDPSRIEKQLRVLTERNDIDLVSTGVLSLNDNNKPVGVRCVALGHKVTAKNLLTGNSGIVHASVLARKSWYQRNYYREDYPAAEDSELWVRAYSSSDLNVFFIPEPLYFYREDGNVTKSKLLRGYKLGRRIIIESAKHGFSFRLKFYIYARNYFKSLVVFLLSSFHGLEVLRNKRNSVAPSVSEFDNYNYVLKSIKEYSLPVSSS